MLKRTLEIQNNHHNHYLVVVGHVEVLDIEAEHIEAEHIEAEHIEAEHARRKNIQENIDIHVKKGTIKTRSENN